MATQHVEADLIESQLDRRHVSHNHDPKHSHLTSTPQLRQPVPHIPSRTRFHEEGLPQKTPKNQPVDYARHPQRARHQPAPLKHPPDRINTEKHGDFRGGRRTVHRRVRPLPRGGGRGHMSGLRPRQLQWQEAGELLHVRAGPLQLLLVWRTAEGRGGCRDCSSGELAEVKTLGVLLSFEI